MRFFLDTEFHDRPEGTDLLSLGLVAADGRELYRVSADYDRAAADANPWLAANVLPLLDRDGEPAPVPLATIAQDVAAFCAACDDGRRPEVWAWNGAYDFYLLAKLFGRLLDVPAAVPTLFLDLKQWARSLGNVTVPAQGADVHHALADARHDLATWAWLGEFEQARLSKRDERVRTKLVAAATSALRAAPLR